MVDSYIPFTSEAAREVAAAPSIVPAGDDGESLMSASYSDPGSSPVTFRRTGSLYTGTLPTGGGGESGHWKGMTGNSPAVPTSPAGPTTRGGLSGADWAASTLGGATSVGPTPAMAAASAAPLALGPGEKSYGSASGTPWDLLSRARTRAALDAAFGTDQELQGPDYSEAMTKAYAGDTLMNRAQLGSKMSELLPPGAASGLKNPTTGEPISLPSDVPLSRETLMGIVQGINQNPARQRLAMLGPQGARVQAMQDSVEEYEARANGLEKDPISGKWVAPKTPIPNDVRQQYKGFAEALRKSLGTELAKYGTQAGLATGRYSGSGVGSELKDLVGGGGF